jgi:O-antigen/teichoic acid export membrane protein
MAINSIRNLFIKNAVANVLGGAGTALFNLLLPALVVRHLGKLEFSVWSLTLQVLIYLQLFGFGLQTAMTKYIAHGNEINDTDDQRKTIKAGLMLVSGFTLMALVAVGLLALFYPMFFKDVPVELMGEFRLCIVILGISASMQLFALVPSGVFLGLQKNIIPVSGLLFVRISSLIGIWLVLSNGGSLVNLSMVLAGCGLMILPISYLYARRWAGSLITQLGAIDWARCRELLRYCASLAIWSVAMLFVNGIDLVIVGHYDFDKVASYSLAITAIAILVGVTQAVLSPLVAIGSASYANLEKRSQLPKLLTISSAGCGAFLIVTIGVFLFLGKPLLSLWLDASYVDSVYALLSVMLFAHALRNLLMPFALLLVAISEHKKAFLPAIIEGVFNLTFSLLLAPKFGVTGIVYGTLIGSAAGVLSFVIFVAEKTRVLSISRLYFIKNIILVPVLILALLFWIFHR